MGMMMDARQQAQPAAPTAMSIMSMMMDARPQATTEMPWHARPQAKPTPASRVEYSLSTGPAATETPSPTLSHSRNECQHGQAGYQQPEQASPPPSPTQSSPGDNVQAKHEQQVCLKWQRYTPLESCQTLVPTMLWVLPIFACILCGLGVCAEEFVAAGL